MPPPYNVGNLHYHFSDFPLTEKLATPSIPTGIGLKAQPVLLKWQRSSCLAAMLCLQLQTSTQLLQAPTGHRCHCQMSANCQGRACLQPTRPIALSLLPQSIWGTLSTGHHLDAMGRYIHIDLQDLVVPVALQHLRFSAGRSKSLR